MDSPDNQQISRSLRLLSPKRNTTQARNVDELIAEQQAHFGIDPSTPFGKSLAQIVRGLYESQAGIDDLWKITMESMATLETKDRIARFNAKKFLSFQLAKLIDTLQHPFRKSYQSLNYSLGTLARELADHYKGKSWSENVGIPIAAGLIVGEALIGVGYAINYVLGT